MATNIAANVVGHRGVSKADVAGHPPLEASAANAAQWLSRRVRCEVSISDWSHNAQANNLYPVIFAVEPKVRMCNQASKLSLENLRPPCAAIQPHGSGG